VAPILSQEFAFVVEDMPFDLGTRSLLILFILVINTKEYLEWSQCHTGPFSGMSSPAGKVLMKGNKQNSAHFKCRHGM